MAKSINRKRRDWPHSRLVAHLVLIVVATACGTDAGDATRADDDASALVAAAATADDTFDPAFYDPDGGDFPALDDPAMVPAAAADWLDPDDIVMGISDGDESRAYPVDQMAYHHVANTRLAGEPFVVTY